MDSALSGATTPGQSGPGSGGNKGVLRIPQSSSITGTSPSDCLVSYPGHSSGGYPSAEVQSVYSTAPADWGMGRSTNINQPSTLPVCLFLSSSIWNRVTDFISNDDNRYAKRT